MFKKTTQRKGNKVVEMPPYEVVGGVGKKGSEGHTGKYIPNYEDIPISTLKNMKKQQ